MKTNIYNVLTIAQDITQCDDYPLVDTVDLLGYKFVHENSGTQKNFEVKELL